MRSFRPFSRLFTQITALALALALLSACTAGDLSGNVRQETAAAEETAAPAAETEAPAETPEPTPVPDVGSEDIVLSEVMPGNTACLRDADGAFYDWVELENTGSEDISLENWVLSDGSHNWKFPETTIAAGGFLLVRMGGGSGDELRTDFALSSDDTVSLSTPSGRVLFSCACSDAEANMSLVWDAADGSYKLTADPTPGFANTVEGLSGFQETLTLPGTLCIWEIYVFGTGSGSDWVELYNNSQAKVTLSDYMLSDDPDDPDAFQLPSLTLAPGQTYVVYCGDGGSGHAPFSLDCTSEQLYLSNADGIVDYAAAAGIRAGGTVGRMKDMPGWFYFSSATRGAANTGGERYVLPQVSAADGVYNDVSSVTVTLSGSGTIRYTTDCSEPTADSEIYTGPFELTETTIVKAMSFSEGALPSETAVFSYIINENVTLPVISLTTTTLQNGRYITGITQKSGVDVPGTFSFYEDGCGVTAGCGINLSGQWTTQMPHKSFKLHFNGLYGDDGLHYDVFGNGVDCYKSLILRKGQDADSMIFRTEMWEDICSSFSDNVILQDHKFCILFFNGEYYGITSMREDFSRTFYAGKEGVSKSSVEWYRFPVHTSGTFYDEVVYPCVIYGSNMPDDVYQTLLEHLDIDNFIDWFLIEGVCGNTDFITNAAVFRSTENGGKWQFALVDLDYAFDRSFCGLFGYTQYSSSTVSYLLKTLISKPDFMEKLFARYAEIRDLVGNEAILAKLDEYEALLAPEIERDADRWFRGSEHMTDAVESIRSLVTSKDWENYCLYCLIYYTKADDALVQKYFPDYSGWSE